MGIQASASTLMDDEKQYKTVLVLSIVVELFELFELFTFCANAACLKTRETIKFKNQMNTLIRDFK
jgi:hypothetical protein